MIRAFLVVAALVGISWLIALTIGFVREWRRSREPRPFLRFERHSEYGSHLWVGRVRFGSRRTMTPMWPHVYKGGDEWCNDVLCFHLYPLVSIDIWWQLKQRTWRDGICEVCKQELRDAGWSEATITAYNEAAKLMDESHNVEQYERELNELLGYGQK